MLTKEQIELRSTRVGASEVGALLGLDPYKSALDVFMEKTLPAPDRTADHQTWGLDQEPGILRYHARKKGYELLPPPGSLAHPTLPLVCTPDGLAASAEGTVAIQAKNDQGFGQIEWGEPGTDDAPLLYVAQATIEIGVLIAAGFEVSRDELAVSIRGAPPVCYPIKFDAELFGQLAEVCAKWKRDHLDTGKPPDGTPSEVAEYVKRRFPKPSGTMLQPTPELVALWQQVAWFRTQAKALEEEKIKAENALKLALGDADGIVGVCTYKLQKGSTYQVTKQPTRVLRKAGAKEE